MMQVVRSKISRRSQAAEPARPLAVRLSQACSRPVAEARAAGLNVTLRCAVRGDVLSGLAKTILATAAELVSVAVRDGMQSHLIGTIDLQLVTGRGGTTLSVIDDGWATKPRDYEYARLVAERSGGLLDVVVSWERTQVSVLFLVQ